MRTKLDRSRPFPALVAALAASAPGGWQSAPPAAQHNFWDLGELPGGAAISYAYGISSGGDIIAGESYSAGSSVHGEGVRWRRISPTQWEMKGMGFPAPDALNTPAAATAANGRWIVGRVSFEPPTAPAIDTEAYRWGESTGFERLGLPPGFVITAAWDANASGNVVVGYGGPGPGYADLRALAWTKQGATWTVSFLEPGVHSQAVRVDRDGTSTVGWGASPAAVAAAGGNWDPREAALWRRDASGSVGRTWLGAAGSTVFQSQAHDVCKVQSSTLVVGTSGDFALGMRPVVWRVGNVGPATIAELPLPPGFTSGATGAISKSGGRIVGTCWDDDFAFEVCVWDLDPMNGGYAVSILKERLAANGVTAAQNWMLWAAPGISDDGTMLCGSGNDPNFEERGWAAELP